MTVKEALTKSEKQYIRLKVVQPIVEYFSGAKAFGTVQVGPGAQEAGYDKASEVVAAEVIGKSQNFPRDILEETRATVAIPKIGKGFSLSREDVLTARANGTPINARWAVQAGKIIARKLDDVYFNGISSMNISGMVGSAGNTQAATAVWSGGSATPFDDVNDAVGLIEDDKAMGKRILFLHPTNRGEVRKRDSNSHRYDSLIMGTAKEGDDALVDAIATTWALSEGTGLIATVGDDIAQRYIAEAMKNEDEYVNANQSFEWNFWAREVPLIYEANGYSKITGI